MLNCCILREFLCIGTLMKNTATVFSQSITASDTAAPPSNALSSSISQPQIHRTLNCVSPFQSQIGETGMNNPSTKSKRKRNGKKKKKKNKVPVESQENVNLDIVKTCEFKVSSTEARPKTLQTPSIGKSVVCLRKKLLVLDLNGLLADIISNPFPKNIQRDATIGMKALYKRPFYSEFLDFCFEKFDVAVWSSRLEKNVNSIVNCLMGNRKERLIFCWSNTQCTKTDIKTLQDNHKTLIFKDLRKIWNKYDPNLPWEKGYYNESNTLLLDDSPYKGLLNPPHNSVFPHTYSCRNRNDNSLAVGGDIRKYLEGLANAEDMVKYVEQHPFGQERITERSKHWNFYLNALLGVLLKGS